VASAQPRAPIGVLLLPVELEQFALREPVERLRRARGVVAVDPPRVSYAGLGRMPGPFVDAISARQARRLVRALRRRVGEPRVVVVFTAGQYPLARVVLGLCAGSELWYWRLEEAPLDERKGELDALAVERARLITAGADEDPEDLWDGLDDAGVDLRPR
jgi:hypothetical protein